MSTPRHDMRYLLLSKNYSNESISSSTHISSDIHTSTTTFFFFLLFFLLALTLGVNELPMDGKIYVVLLHIDNNISTTSYPCIQYFFINLLMILDTFPPSLLYKFSTHRKININKQQTNIIYWFAISFPLPYISPRLSCSFLLFLSILLPIEDRVVPVVVAVGDGGMRVDGKERKLSFSSCERKNFA